MRISPATPAAAASPDDDVEMQACIDPQTECAICFNTSSQLLEKMTSLERTACGHVFCGECLGLYCLKRPAAPEVVPCPLCRAALPQESLPISVNVNLKPLATSQLGVVLGYGPKSAAVCIVDVAPDSLASAAGLRSGLSLLAVNDTPVESLAHANDALGSASAGRSQVGDSGQREMRLRVGGLRASSVREMAATALARAQVIPTQSFADNSPWRGVFCYCSLVAQLWQWLTQARRRSCYLAALALWTLFLLGIGLDVLSDPIASGFSSNASYGDFFLRNLVNNIGTSKVAAPEHRYVGPLLMFTCFCLCTGLGSTMLWKARARLLQEDPAIWAMVTDDLPASDAYCFTHRWVGPYCCSFILLPRMIDALERSGQIVRSRGWQRSCPCQPLPPAPHEMAWTVGDWV